VRGQQSRSRAHDAHAPGETWWSAICNDALSQAAANRLPGSHDTRRTSPPRPRTRLQMLPAAAACLLLLLLPCRPTRVRHRLALTEGVLVRCGLGAQLRHRGALAGGGVQVHKGEERLQTGVRRVLSLHEGRGGGSTFGGGRAPMIPLQHLRPTASQSAPASLRRRTWNSCIRMSSEDLPVHTTWPCTATSRSTCSGCCTLISSTDAVTSSGEPRPVWLREEAERRRRGWLKRVRFRCAGLSRWSVRDDAGAGSQVTQPRLVVRETAQLPPEVAGLRLSGRRGPGVRRHSACVSLPIGAVSHPHHQTFRTGTVYSEDGGSNH
jgi:hypothetical protein